MKKCVKDVFTGNGKKLDVSKVSKVQLRKGIKVEMEHTDKKDVARRIALDHLAESPVYYDELDKLEKSMDLKAKKSRKK